MKIDVCGLNCPEPVIMVRKAMLNGEKELEVICDAQVAVENISRLCNKMNYNIEVKSGKDNFILNIIKK